MSYKFKPLLGWSFALLLSASLTGCSLLPAEEAPLKPPLVKPVQESYQTVIVEKGSIIKEITGSGAFESTKSVTALFKSRGGRIAEMVVTVGDDVKKGDVLVQLDVEGLDLQIKEQELAYARAKQSFKQTKLGGDIESTEIAELQMEIEDEKLKRLRATFENRHLRAEVNGLVTFVESLEEGDMVEAYQPLVTISDPSKLRFIMWFDPAVDISRVDVGYPAKITFNGKDVMGKVVQTPSSVPETSNKELDERHSKALYIVLPQMPEAASVGVIANVSIIMERSDNTLKIPRGGLREYQGRKFVRTLEEGNKIREIDVQTGIVTPSEVEIMKGLEEGMKVVMP